MTTTIEQQVTLDEFLVPSAQRLRIMRRNFRLPSDNQSKESTLQVVYDVLRRSPFFKAFLVTADVPEIYMQEFWATAYVHQHSIRFKMDTKKNIVDLEAFSEMLHISPRVLGQSFAELPFEEEILECLRFLGHSTQIKTLTDVNVNKFYQPWRSFVAIINKCLTGKSYGFDSLRNTKAYKEYYACAIGEAAPKPKASARRKRGGSASSTTPPTPIATPTPIITVVAAPRLTVAAKGKQPARATSLTDPSEDNDDDDDEEEISKIDEQEATESGEGDDEETKSDGESEEEETREEVEESFDLTPRTPEDSEDDGNGKEDQGLRISEEERMHEEEEADELYRMESIFTTASSSVTPLPSPTSTMTRSIITTTRTASQPPIPPTPIPSEVLQNLPTFESVFRFEDIVKSLEVNFSKFMPTNQFPEAVSNIPANLLKMELKKILINKMEGNKEDARMMMIRKDPPLDQTGGLREGREHASASTPSELATRSARRSTTGTQSRQMSANESAFAEEPVQTTCQMDETSHLVFETSAEDQPIVQTSLLSILNGSAQSWISELAKQADARSSFNELLDTPIDFSNFIMNRLGVDTLTPELLAGPTYELMRGSCNSLTELEYHLEEVYKVTTDQLDWVHPKGQQYPHNLLQPLPLIPGNRGRRVILFEHFINNDLEYLRGGASSRKYTTSVTKTKAADYGHTKWIEDLVPRAMWIHEPLNYDKHALWGVSHWGRKRQQFYGFDVNRESALDVYSKRRIIAVTDLKIVEWHNYKHLDWISVRRYDDKIYKFKEGDFKRLRLQDIEDMLLLLVQGKLSNLTVEERFAFNVSLMMFTRSIVIQRHVEDLQLGVESYQKRLNLTKPDTMMQIDELQKFSDGTLNDVRNALDDRLKGIRMQYLPTTIWRKGDKDRTAAMIQAIDKML
nr:hypothetical protein [Tanacetum cinerariifolium]